jgi:hypothetical protein
MASAQKSEPKEVSCGSETVTESGCFAYGPKQMNVLFICSNRQACWYLAKHLEQLGCHCWFASTIDELRVLLGQRTFRLVVSTRPVTEQGSLMRLLQAPDRFVFYSFPVEDGCLWFQALPEISAGLRVSALRPSEFLGILDDLVKSEGDFHECGSQFSERFGYSQLPRA